MKNTIVTKTSRSKGENEEKPEKRLWIKEMEIGSPLTAGELEETTGGGEQDIVTTPSKIVFETIAYASMWPRGQSNAEESKD